jgi:hypothetical protein
MSGEKGKAAKKADVQSTIDHLTAVYDLLKKPIVAGNPVIRALIQGLNKSNDDFKTASLVVSTLRNAGCVVATTNQQADSNKESSVKTKKDKTSPREKLEPTPAVKKLRGLNRSLDYLIATYVIKDDDKAILSLRNLRKDKDKVIKIKKSDESIVERKISAIDDYDLLYLMDRDSYDDLMDKVGSLEPKIEIGGFYEPGAFGIWNQDSPISEFIGAISEKVSDGKEKLIFQEGMLGGYSPLARVLKGSVMDGILQVLKDVTITEGDITPTGEDEVKLYQMIVDTLLRENWFKFGKSPTISSMVTTPTSTPASVAPTPVQAPEAPAAGAARTAAAQAQKPSVSRDSSLA